MDKIQAVRKLRSIQAPQIPSNIKEIVKNAQINESTKHRHELKKNMHQFYDHINKCRCCFTGFDKRNKRVVIRELHQELFRSIFAVELRMDPTLSANICRNCDNKLIKLSLFIQIVSDVQKDFSEFVDMNDSNIVVKDEIVPYDVIVHDIQPEHENDEHIGAAIETERQFFRIHQANSISITDYGGRVVKVEKHEQEKVNSNPMISMEDCCVNLERLDEDIIKKFKGDNVALMNVKIERKHSARKNGTKQEDLKSKHHNLSRHTRESKVDTAYFLHLIESLSNC